MFAALYAGVPVARTLRDGVVAPSLPVAALIDVARAFTPRFEQIGSVVLLDASGLSRLFGSAQELGEHLRDALIKASGGEAACPERIFGMMAMPNIESKGGWHSASTQTAATLLALGTPGLTVVMPGKEAIALAPLSVSVLDAFEKLSEPSASAREQSSELRRDAASASGLGGGWHHPRKHASSESRETMSSRKSSARDPDEVGNYAWRADRVVRSGDSRTPG